MSWQSPVNSVVGEDLDDFVENIVNFDTYCFESPSESFDGGQDREPGHGIENDVGSKKPKVLTIMAGISSIYRHLETERKKGNARPSVVIKLKDPNKHKSITFSIPVLHSPTTTDGSGVSSRSCTPSRPPSPESCLPEGHTLRTKTAKSSPEEAISPAIDSEPNIITSPLFVPNGSLLSLSEDAILSALPVPTGASLEQAIVSPPRSIAAADLSALTGEDTGFVVAQHKRGTTSAYAVANPDRIGQDKSSCTTTLAPIHSQNASKLSQTSQASASVSSKKMSNDTYDKFKQERSINQKKISFGGESGRMTKRPRLEMTDLATLLHNTDKIERVKEMTADQDPSLVYKMVRNARAILPEPAIDDPPPLATIDISPVILYDNSGNSTSLQENIMQRFCDTVRRIEWAETLTFLSMVEYRILFVQLYQQYQSLQKLVDTKKGERRVTVSKERLYTMLYPNNPKKARNGKLSDEWEKFNRCIRRGKQWYTIASELGTGILRRMPSSIRHTWVEQKLQTKMQLYLWIEIFKLLT